jgi:hypothetical protein
MKSAAREGDSELGDMPGTVGTGSDTDRYETVGSTVGPAVGGAA